MRNISSHSLSFFYERRLVLHDAYVRVHHNYISPTQCNNLIKHVLLQQQKINFQHSDITHMNIPLLKICIFFYIANQGKSEEQFFSLIFHVILSVKIKLLQIDYRFIGLCWIGGWGIKKIRFGVLKDQCDHFWPCQMFIFIFIPFSQKKLFAQVDID